MERNVVGLLDERADLSGKLAIVLGGAGGMGRAITCDLARSGVNVALCDVDERALADTTKELARDGTCLMSSVVDVLNSDALSQFFAEFDQVADHLDILVNVVGGIHQQPFMETSPEQRDKIVLENFGYVVASSYEGVKRIRFSGNGGSVVNITTIEAHRAAPGFSVYAGAKAAITNFSRSLAVELAPEHIRINTVAPECIGYQTSAMPSYPWANPEQAADLMRAGYRMYVPMGSVGAAEDISSCVLFLASDLARFITGSTVHVDGGTWASSGWLNWPTPGRGFLPMPPPAILEKLFHDGTTSNEASSERDR